MDVVKFLGAGVPTNNDNALVRNDCYEHVVESRLGGGGWAGCYLC